MTNPKQFARKIGSKFPRHDSNKHNEKGTPMSQKPPEASGRSKGIDSLSQPGRGDAEKGAGGSPG